MKWLATLTLNLLIAPALCAADIPANIAAAVAATSRSDKDRERDARDKPAELLAFAGVKPGMTVADVLGGGGYWSEILAGAVGPTGSVSLVNNEGYYKYGEKGIAARFAGGRLKDVQQIVGGVTELGMGKARYDFIMIFMSYHDIYWVDEKQGWPKVDADSFVRQLHDALKPGGKLLIVDHAAKAGTGSSAAQDLHRIDEEFAKQDFASHGFRLEKTWDGLRNASDDHTKGVFDEAVRGKTDRFTHLYAKR